LYPLWVSNVARLATILSTLNRYDLIAPILEIGGAGWFNPARFAAGRGFRDLRVGERWNLAAQELGPTFIKLGQALATRPDFIGDELADDLAELQDRVPPFPGEQARGVIEAELGVPISQLYQSFDDTPVAAASIAQVHFAVTTEGREVAVKVLRPGIIALFNRDMELFTWLAGIAERVRPSLRRLKPREVARTLAAGVVMEMDLRFEAAAASELAENFAGDPGFRVPAIDWTRTSRSVITLERVSGIRVDDREALIAAGHDLRAVLTNAAESFFNQVFRDGFFHADLHPGNLFVASDGGLVAVDFGIMGRLDRPTRYYLADMLLGFLTGDYERVARVHFEAGYIPADQSMALFTQACRSIGEPLLGKSLTEISLAQLLGQLFEVTETFQMETQPQLLLLQKTMVVAEGVGRSLEPSLNMWELARPLIEDWVRANRGPEARVRDGLQAMLAGLERLPKALGLVGEPGQGGVKLHPDTIEALAAALGRRAPSLAPVWLAIGAIVLWILFLSFS
jgi:ubiquinone biosynthesis protein